MRKIIAMLLLLLGLCSVSNAEELATYADVAKALNEVHRAHYGVDSQFLTQVQELGPEDTDKPATRFFFAQALYCSAMEDVFDFPYENYYVWAENCAFTDTGFSFPDSQIIGTRLDGTVGEGGVWDFCPDCSEIDVPPEDERYQNYLLDYGSTPAVNYAILSYDRRDGRKVLELDNYYFHPYQTMTAEEVKDAIDRYDHSFEDVPEMISYEETKHYDASIITDAILAKESDLPDASCAELPSSWHGVLMFDMGRVPFQCLDNQPDKQIYDYELQAIKDAGFNFVGVAFDFSTLQGPKPMQGMLNETRLKQLDQVIAWCIERDIHVDLRCAGPGGCALETPFSEWEAWNYDVVQSTEYAAEFGRLWGALAQRYVDIPNRYLSFNLLIEAPVHSDEQYVAFFGPAVEAIKTVSPDRCIIADVHSGGLTGEGIAEMGVALSYHAYDPREFCALDNDTEEYLSTVQWPFTASDGKIYDAEAVLNSQIDHSVSANELAAIAEKKGVGFMIGEWGIFGMGLSRYRYPEKTIKAFLTEMGDILEEKGYGWCYGGINCAYGILSYAPAVLDADYVQVGDHALYMDTLIAGIFKEICE